MVLEKLDSHMQKNEIELLSYTKINHPAEKITQNGLKTWKYTTIGRIQRW